MIHIIASDAKIDAEVGADNKDVALRKGTTMPMYWQKQIRP